MKRDIDWDFVNFCRKATDIQLENILLIEHNKVGLNNYREAVLVATGRGWVVTNGVRVC